MIPPQRLVIQRVHNNNVVLALDARGRGVVVTGPGVGFGARRGVLVDTERAEAVYVPEDTSRADAAAGTLAQIPPVEILLARGILEQATALTGLARPETLLLPIADHLHHAIARAREGVVIDLPLVWEVRHLYPRELAAGRTALDMIEQRLGVRLPGDEATAFALHFVSATFSGEVLDRTVSMTQALAEIFDVLEEETGTRLDRESEAAARFVTHLRFLFVRLADGRKVTVAPALVGEALESSVPEVVRLAREVAAVLDATWGQHLSVDETTYIALHVHRLLSDAGHGH
ncbi:BglG family transcription antiterminator [Brachybacterium hainanense]|uniref:BglG family transcription antiterminator n=1 Tax=Brachybacterium hainanense TaxID=1541174 RepID=A0ABV6R5U2_9MICO